MVLDIVGLIPGAGAPADILNGIISAGRGDFIGAALSIFGVVPIAGEAATLAKIAKNSEKYLQALKVVESKVLPLLPAGARKKVQEALDAARKKLDDLLKKDKPDAPATKPAPAPPAPPAANPPGAKVKGDGPRSVCKLLAAAVYAQVPEVAKRFLDKMEDKLGLFKLTVNPDGSKGAPHPSLPKGSGTWHGHNQQLRQIQKSLRDSIGEYDAAKCTQPKIPKSVRDLSYMGIPTAPGGIPGYPFTSLPK